MTMSFTKQTLCKQTLCKLAGLAALALSLTLGAGCGGRAASSGDSGPANDSGLRVDRGARFDGASTPDGCSYPADGCHGKGDCKPGFVCTASTECLPDPCCPMCNGCYGRCVPTCKSNADCAKSELCQRPEGSCTTEGRCAKRPHECPELYSPVCGCDGKTYFSGPCSAHAAGVSVAAKGACKDVCNKLQKDYATLLAKAQQCCATCDEMDPCTKTVSSALGCGCPTPVNVNSKQLLKQLEGLEQQYAAAKCSPGACPGCAPPPPVPPSCRPSPSGGVCGY
jgi:hypothetical protein